MYILRIIKESKWFKPSTVEIGRHLKDSYVKYKQYVLGGKQQKQYSKSNFSFEKMQALISTILEKNIPYLKTFLFLSYPYQADKEIHGFEFDAINRYAREKVGYVCRGGLFGGHKDFIRQANSTYYALLQDTLEAGYMGTEESIFSIMAHLEPHLYRRYALDDNGLIVKFVQALLDDQVQLENNGARAHVLPKGTYNENTDKTSLYMLTFNFPEQVEHTLKTWEDNSPDWLSKPRKILIDNSNKPEAIEGNKQICEKYGFEHIITNENLGINRGRLLAAKHFQELEIWFLI